MVNFTQSARVLTHPNIQKTVGLHHDAVRTYTRTILPHHLVSFLYGAVGL